MLIIRIKFLILNCYFVFVVGDMVAAAGGNYTQLSISGGVVAVPIEWICNLDWDFQKYCLPK